ncbi:zinc-dependent peptidase [Ideonella sp. BN130291]|uniref:M90 family metallopeptidase n=1 Tax=Ideonella sp. BN130291 TaxID=3112940 RepID=UPI002E275271|nr:M90 family metallopeptidase [Ideonella sp. BN130291]
MLARWWQRWQLQRESRALQRRAIPDALWQLTLLRYPFLAQRPDADVQALRRLTSLFLDRKEFHGVDGLEVSDDIAVAVAAQACLPVLRLGLSAYDGFVSVVLHADEVVARRVVTDEDGVVHEYDEPLVGEASIDTGQVMLSWTDVRDAQELTDWGYNVVIHEFAHVLDALNGEIDGIPGLASTEAYEQWAAVLDEEYERFCGWVDAGRETVLDPYGAQAPEEFFAVASEAFFVAPQPMKKEQPALYRLLSGYFQQDPAAPLAT